MILNVHVVYLFSIYTNWYTQLQTLWIFFLSSMTATNRTECIEQRKKLKHFCFRQWEEIRRWSRIDIKYKKSVSKKCTHGYWTTLNDFVIVSISFVRIANTHQYISYKFIVFSVLRVRDRCLNLNYYDFLR